MEQIDVEYEDLVEFSIDSSISVFYSRTYNVWFLEDYESDDFILLEDVENGVSFEEGFSYKEHSITLEDFINYKSIVERNKNA